MKWRLSALYFYLFFDDLVGIADAVDDVPAADAGFDGDKGEGDIRRTGGGCGYQLLKKNKYFFGMAAVAEVVVAGVDDDGIRGGRGRRGGRRTSRRRRG
jgi:hypothetical protein